MYQVLGIDLLRVAVIFLKDTVLCKEETGRGRRAPCACGGWNDDTRGR